MEGSSAARAYIVHIHARPAENIQLRSFARSSMMRPLRPPQNFLVVDG